MAESEGVVKQQTLYISIAVALLVGFLMGIIYSDRSPQSGGQVAQQGQGVPQQAAQQEQMLQAIASLELAVTQNPNSAETWTRLGNAYFDTDQPVKAIEAYAKSLAIIPGNPSVLTDMGVMYRRNGQPEKAIESFDQALKINPGLEQALFNKGIVLLNDLGKSEEALKTWKELLLINPGARAPDGSPLSELVDNLPAFQQNK